MTWDRRTLERMFYEETGSWCKASEKADRWIKERELEEKIDRENELNKVRNR